MNDFAVSALYAAMTPQVVEARPDLEDIEADRRYTQAVAAEYALRFFLSRKVAA